MFFFSFSSFLLFSRKSGIWFSGTLIASRFPNEALQFKIHFFYVVGAPLGISFIFIFPFFFAFFFSVFFRFFFFSYRVFVCDSVFFFSHSWARRVNLHHDKAGLIVTAKEEGLSQPCCTNRSRKDVLWELFFFVFTSATLEGTKGETENGKQTKKKEIKKIEERENKDIGKKKAKVEGKRTR